MSLFGGDSQATSPAETDNELSQSPSRASSTQLLSPSHAETVAEPLHSSEIESTDTSGLDSSDTDEREHTRPNRFKGRKVTWRAHTAAERQIHASLEQERNTDLAAHLYNAHALKRRVQRPIEELSDIKPWQSREHWYKKGSDLEYTDVSGEILRHLVPSRDWTAWPLPPAELPVGEGAGTVDDGIYSTFNAHDIGDDMREEMLAVFIRLAKERWNARDPPDERDRAQTEMRRSRSQSRATKARSTSRPPSAATSARPTSDEESMESDHDRKADEQERKFPTILSKRRGRKPLPEATAEPVFLADDAKAQRILMPTINSMLSNLDDLLLAIRRTRMNHFGRGGDSDLSSYSDFTSGAESPGPTSRSRSRSQSTRASVKAQRGRATSRRADTGASSNEDSDAYSARTEASRRKRAWSESTNGGRSTSTNRDETVRTGLMDWSEVLSLAAIKGWDERALARTAQRCANLFGQSISFHVLDESRVTEPIPDPVTYVPSTIPGPEELLKPAEKRPLFQTGTLRCPHVECYGHERDFASAYRVIEHCMRSHGYDPRTNDSDNEDRKVGAVHIDGFLQPIPAQHGWLGRGRSKAGITRKRQKRVKDESPDVDHEAKMDID